MFRDDPEMSSSVSTAALVHCFQFVTGLSVCFRAVSFFLVVHLMPIHLYHSPFSVNAENTQTLQRSIGSGALVSDPCLSTSSSSWIAIVEVAAEARATRDFTNTHKARVKADSERTKGVCPCGKRTDESAFCGRNTREARVK